MGAVFLASKLEEQPRRLRDIVNTFDYLRKAKAGANTEPLELFSQEYYDAKKTVIAAEMSILNTLGFHVCAQHPHGMLLCYLSQLELTGNVQMKRRAWCLLNDRYATI